MSHVKRRLVTGLGLGHASLSKCKGDSARTGRQCEEIAGAKQLSPMFRVSRLPKLDVPGGQQFHKIHSPVARKEGVIDCAQSGLGRKPQTERDLSAGPVASTQCSFKANTRLHVSSCMWPSYRC